jgi:hypothetical protein
MWRRMGRSYFGLSSGEGAFHEGKLGDAAPERGSRSLKEGASTKMTLLTELP